MRTWLILVFSGLWLVLQGAGAVPVRRPSEWRDWERRNATIGEIVIHIQPIFDLGKPAENNWLGRTANHLHIATREIVVRRVLLFKEGDRVVARDILQTERLLRGLAFIKDARIQAEAAENGKVRAHVWVRDAWTIDVTASFQQVGGQKTVNFGLQDQNILGTGKTVGASFTKDRERANSQFSYRDPQLLGSRWKLDADYQALSDGNGRTLHLERPFFSLDTPWSATIGGQSRKSKLTIYDQGKGIFEAPYWSNSVRLGAAWAMHQKDDRVWRAGVALVADDRRYGEWSILNPLTTEALPVLSDRRQRGPAFTLAFQQDAYESFTDMQGMDTPEDFNLAWGGSLELGAFTRRLGSTRPGSYLQINVSNAWSPSPEELTLFKGSLTLRPGSTNGENLRLSTSVSSYFQVTPTYHLAGFLGLTRIRRPDPENYDYIGAAEGLRGYPNAIHSGNAHWIFSLENRFFTEQRWWGLFRVGYVAFLDVGAVHRMNGQGWSPAYPNLGVGLRLGDLKSSLARVLLVTVTVPLARQPGQSRWQFGIGNTIQF